MWGGGASKVSLTPGWVKGGARVVQSAVGVSASVVLRVFLFVGSHICLFLLLVGVFVVLRFFVLSHLFLLLEDVFVVIGFFVPCFAYFLLLLLGGIIFSMMGIMRVLFVLVCVMVINIAVYF